MVTYTQYCLADAPSLSFFHSNVIVSNKITILFNSPNRPLGLVHSRIIIFDHYYLQCCFHNHSSPLSISLHHFSIRFFPIFFLLFLLHPIVSDVHDKWNILYQLSYILAMNTTHTHTHTNHLPFIYIIRVSLAKYLKQIAVIRLCSFLSSRPRDPSILGVFRLAQMPPIVFRWYLNQAAAWHCVAIQ